MRFLLPIVLIIGGLTALYMIWGEQIITSHKNATILSQERRYRALLLAAEQLKYRYERGDEEGLIERGWSECSDIPAGPLVNRDYTKCNPHYLNCFLKSQRPRMKNRFLVNLLGKDYKIKANPIGGSLDHGGVKYYKIISKLNTPGKHVPHYAVQVNLSIEGEEGSLNVLLEDVCRDVYLPQRSYVYREHSLKNSKEHVWNNFNQDIYIDKRLVNFRDIVDWLEAGGEEKITIPQDRAQWALPASNLTASQMEKYCHFLGKRVASAQVYDAASFYPINLDQSTYVDRSFPPFPWSKRKLAHKLSRIRGGHSPFDEVICKDVLTRECRERKRTLQNSSDQRRSWSGMKDILGGHPEYLHNPIASQYNLKVSSFYMPSQSPWHQLGWRGSWSEKGFSQAEFSFQGEKIFIDEKDRIRVGFRCMLERTGGRG